MSMKQESKLVVVKLCSQVKCFLCIVVARDLGTVSLTLRKWSTQGSRVGHPRLGPGGAGS